jgi:hypothetical protein
MHAYCKHMFQVFQMFHTYVASVSSGCCICLQWFLSVFRRFCKCFISLLLYVVAVVFGCFKSELWCYTWGACVKWLAARTTSRAA